MWFMVMLFDNNVISNSNLSQKNNSKVLIQQFFVCFKSITNPMIFFLGVDRKSFWIERIFYLLISRIESWYFWLDDKTDHYIYFSEPKILFYYPSIENHNFLHFYIQRMKRTWDILNFNLWGKKYEISVWVFFSKVKYVWVSDVCEKNLRIGYVIIPSLNMRKTCFVKNEWIVVKKILDICWNIILFFFFIFFLK